MSTFISSVPPPHFTSIHVDSSGTLSPLETERKIVNQLSTSNNLTVTHSVKSDYERFCNAIACSKNCCETSRALLVGLISICAMSYIGYSQYTSVENAFSSNCNDISRITNTTTSAYCHQLDSAQESLANECIKKLQVGSWSMALAVSVTALPFFSYLITKCLATKYSPLPHRCNHIFLSTIHSVGQSIFTGAILSSTADNLLNNKCYDSCNDQAQYKNCESYCSALCTSEHPVLVITWVSIFYQTIVTTGFAYLNRTYLRA